MFQALNRSEIASEISLSIKDVNILRVSWSGIQRGATAEQELCGRIALGGDQ